MPKGLRCTVEDERINEIFGELKALAIAKHPNAVAILLRVILELSCYRYLVDRQLLASIKTRVSKKKGNRGKGRSPSLTDMLRFMHNEQSIPLDTNARKAIYKVMSDKESMLSIDGMNGFLHNNYLTPTEQELRALFTRIKPIFEITLRPVERDGHT